MSTTTPTVLSARSTKYSVVAAEATQAIVSAEEKTCRDAEWSGGGDCGGGGAAAESPDRYDLSVFHAFASGEHSSSPLKAASLLVPSSDGTTATTAAAMMLMMHPFQVPSSEDQEDGSCFVSHDGGDPSTTIHILTTCPTMRTDDKNPPTLSQVVHQCGPTVGESGREDKLQMLTFEEEEPSEALSLENTAMTEHAPSEPIGGGGPIGGVGGDAGRKDDVTVPGPACTGAPSLPGGAPHAPSSPVSLILPRCRRRSSNGGMKVSITEPTPVRSIERRHSVDVTSKSVLQPQPQQTEEVATVHPQDHHQQQQHRGGADSELERSHRNIHVPDAQHEDLCSNAEILEPANLRSSWFSCCGGSWCGGGD